MPASELPVKTLETTQPLEIEIGSGRGNYLVERAARFPRTQFVGIECKSKLVRLSEQKIFRARLQNIRFIDQDAREALADWPRESVSVFHIYFPDPWFKRKHLRRRLLTADFLDSLYDLLSPEGRIEMATDDPDYFAQMKNEVSRSKRIWRHIRESINQRLFDETSKTLFETKYEARGKRLYYLELAKK